MNKHIRSDIESNLLLGKEPFWKNIKKMTFTPDKGDSDTSSEAKFTPKDKSF